MLSILLSWLAILVVVGAESGASAAGAGANLLVAGGGGVLDRIAHAVDGLESGHGADPHMWRSEPDGPQGPMQVSAAAAADAGGGDRFDERENRTLGRAYLARMFRRYGSWPDAVAAYNWGPGRVDLWISGGRPIDKLPTVVARYRTRVLVASGFPAAASDAIYGPAGFRLASRGIVHMQPRRPMGDRYRLGNGRDPVELLYAEIMRATDPAAR